MSNKKYKHKAMFGTELHQLDQIYQDPCSGDSGGPLMHFNNITGRWSLIGTVQGSGYNCKTGSVGSFEGSDNGLWNKVSFHIDWIKKMMKEERSSRDEEGCPNLNKFQYVPTPYK